MFHLRYCKTGGHYTMKEECHSAKTISPHPPRFNIDDPYGDYRRMVKYENVHKRD